jgi:hypothetical protein
MARAGVLSGGNEDIHRSLTVAALIQRSRLRLGVKE